MIVIPKEVMESKRGLATLGGGLAGATIGGEIANNKLLGQLGGLGIGAAAGGGIATGVGKIRGKKKQAMVELGLEKLANKDLAIGTGLGALLGAGAGHHYFDKETEQRFPEGKVKGALGGAALGLGGAGIVRAGKSVAGGLNNLIDKAGG